MSRQSEHRSEHHVVVVHESEPSKITERWSSKWAGLACTSLSEIHGMFSDSFAPN
jgi:hypothetical protein